MGGIGSYRPDSPSISVMEEKLNQSYGALFVGPPGAGKSTCVATLKEMCDRLQRNCVVINLDPANRQLPYEANFNIRSLTTVKKVMKEHRLGPNGALMYCMDVMAESTDEICDALKEIVVGGSYVLIDCPGQVELYTHSDSVKRFISAFETKLQAKLAVVNLVDVVLASSVSAFLGQSLMSLGTMLRMCAPHINVLSKYDMTAEFELPFDPLNVDFEDFVCAGVPSALHKAIVRVLTDFDLVSYTLFSIKDETAVMELIGLIDKAVGCSWML